ncbi:COLEC10 [Branchiostoma lanceolatum]|uniref:COLEC10 protein n=1 Tax=Branchiostoma lanceolatum TaxID=7740 RepID=A0A8K0EVB3_BRALA|nr:COLEC10 [Branchiostoma lanceolatum]
MSKTNYVGRPLPALPSSNLASPSCPDVDTGPSAKDEDTKEEYPDTSDDPDNNVYHYIDKDDLDNLRLASDHNGQGGQPTAKDADNVGRNGAGMIENIIYVPGALRQDDGDDIDAADDCGFPKSCNLTSHRSFLPRIVVIAITVAAVIGAVAGLMLFLTNTQETHPLSLNSSVGRSGTSSRPMSPVPATPVGSTLENKNDTISPYMIVTEDPTNSLPLPTWNAADGETSGVSLTDLHLETTMFQQTGTTKTVTTVTTTKVFPYIAEGTRFDLVPKTTKQQLSTTLQGSKLPAVSGYTARAGGCPGNDIWFIYGSGMNLSQCASRCSGNSQCVAFQFSNRNCYPKSATCSLPSSTGNSNNTFYDKEAGGCQDGYIRLEWSCVRLVPIPRQFWGAKKACVAEGATLAMPKTKGFDLALRRLVKASGGNPRHWIGMSKTGIKGWKWVDGSPLRNYKGWQPGEPSDFKWLWESLCVQYSSRTMWDDTKCSDKKRYICQSRLA